MHDDVETSSPEQEKNDDYIESFFVVEAAEGHSLKNTSPFVIEKVLLGYMGQPKSVKKLRSGSLLIELARPSQAAGLQKLKAIIDTPVTVSPHRTLNSCRGVIRSIDIINMPEAELLEGLQSQGVIAVKRIISKRGGNVSNTPVVFLTFRGTTLPPVIRVGYLQLKVSQYIQPPLRCFKCQRFGHSASLCKNTAVCAKCGSSEHASADCNNPSKCINCNGTHPSFARNCPEFIKQNKIMHLKQSNNITFKQAESIFLGMPKSYSDTAKTQASTDKKRKFASTATRTECSFFTGCCCNKAHEIKQQSTATNTRDKSSNTNESTYTVIPSASQTSSNTPHYDRVRSGSSSRRRGSHSATQSPHRLVSVSSAGTLSDDPGGEDLGGGKATQDMRSMPPPGAGRQSRSPRKKINLIKFN